MYIVISPTTTEVQDLIGMFHYYMDMWPRHYNFLAPPTVSTSGLKGRKITL